MTAVHVEDANQRRTAADWYLGERPAMLVYAGTGAVVAGLDREVRECLDLLERDHIDADAAWEAEYERLLELLHCVKPEVAMLRARQIGREHGQASVAWWRQDALGGRATGDTTATARGLLQGIEDGDPAVLDELPAWVDDYSAGDLQADCDWEEPLLADDTTLGRWRAVSAQLWTAYQTEFQDAVRGGVVRACREALDQPANRLEAADGAPGRRVIGELDERHLARARHAGAWAALAEATARRMALGEAWAVVSGREHPFVPPTLLGVRASAAKAAAMTCEGSDPLTVDTSTPEQLGAIHARVTRAWEIGRDAVWLNALSAAAMRAIGTHEPEEFLVRITEDRLRALAEAVNGRPDPTLERPYVRPIRAASADMTAGETVPDGWVAQPIGRQSVAAGGFGTEVVYDPRRYDITVIPLGDRKREQLLEAEGWERQDADGLHVLWSHDRIEAARQALARIDQRAAGVSVAGPAQVAEPPAEGLAL